MTARRVRLAVLLALAYFAAARLALLLAIPPGYSTIVWPAAGIAFAALWIWGLDLWPGVFLGSTAANAAMMWSRGDAPHASYLLSAWIGVGAAAQAVAAAALARRALGAHKTLAEEKDLFGFLFFGGLLACLVSSAWATIGMRLFGAIGPDEALFSWATWWVGDAIGVAVAAPLVVLWFKRAEPDSQRTRSAVTAALIATLAGIAAVQHYSMRNEERSVRASAAQQLADLSLTLRVGLAGHLDAVQSAADLFSSMGSVTRAQFALYARGTLERHPGMQALEWRPRVTDARRRAVEDAARRDGLAGYRFTALDEAGRVVTREKAAEYFPILYAEPVRGNEKALGFDINHIQEPLHDAAERALATGLPAASGGVRLVQETGEQTGIAILAAVRRAGDGAPSGLVEGVYRVGDMMETLLAGVDPGALGVRVYDDTTPGAPELLYARAAVPGSPLEPLSVTGDFGGRRWRIELTPSADFQTRSRAPLSWFVLFSSLVFAYLLAWVVLTLDARARRATPSKKAA